MTAEFNLQQQHISIFTRNKQHTFCNPSLCSNWVTQPVPDPH